MEINVFDLSRDDVINVSRNFVGEFPSHKSQPCEVWGP